MAARLILSALGALALAGCFSSADFQQCTSSVQCGLGFRCEANACVPQGGGAGEMGVVDFSGRPDQGGAQVEVIEGGRFTEEQGDQAFPGKTLVLRGVIVVDSPSGITFSAANIQLEGTIEVLGPSGGPGGGGGAGGHASLRFQPGGSMDSPQRGAAATGETGGDGGDGGRGLGLNGGQSGVPGEQGDPDGQPGGDGRFPITSCDDQATLQVGCSGGGGGGGRGADGMTDGCEGGGGGGGGGAGGRAGGAVALEATGTLTLDGQIIAAGSAGTVDPGPDTLGGPPCGGGCSAGCDPGQNGFGGDGARAGGPGQAGGEGAGGGGRGGAGSGGMIRLRAEQIQVPASGQGLLDVSGGGPDNGGLVVVIGAVSGNLEVRGEALRCP